MKELMLLVMINTGYPLRVEFLEPFIFNQIPATTMNLDHSMAEINFSEFTILLKVDSNKSLVLQRYYNTTCLEMNHFSLCENMIINQGSKIEVDVIGDKLTCNGTIKAG